ncbi:hypothetical protein [Massilia sp. BSC265]|uniref:hypothetical protein n=1 Tax=Massilia sp. BSC265 TaxID=1549812 RepID=UPI00126A4E91|nr:hypothetical protein [Massilia sp. BSC265]
MTGPLTVPFFLASADTERALLLQHWLQLITIIFNVYIIADTRFPLIFSNNTGMTAVPPVEAAHQPAEAHQKGWKFSYYPLLGVVLLLLAAVLAYGGLVLLLGDDWHSSSRMEYAGPSKATSSPGR